MHFSILAGAALAPPCTLPLKTWDVVVEGNRILLDKPHTRMSYLNAAPMPTRLGVDGSPA